MPEAFASQNITRGNYYDRRATPTSEMYNAGTVAPHALVSRWAYTVPTGRRAFIETAYVQVMRDAAAAPAVDAQGSIAYTANGGSFHHICRVTLRNNTVGAVERESLGPAAYMIAGDLLEGVTVDDSTGGSCTYVVTSKRVEFDA